MSDLLPTNDWGAIRAHYRDRARRIADAGRSEWGIDPYAWDNGMLSLTPIEYALWCDIRAENAVLYPQFPVLGVFVDFANPVAKVAIECDGKAFHQDKAKDEARDARLLRNGWSVYRITGRDCFTFDDEEARTVGFARSFVREICDRHGIRRGAAEASERMPMRLAVSNFVSQLHRRTA